MSQSVCFSCRCVSRLVRTQLPVRVSAVGCFTSTVWVRQSNLTRSCCVRSAAQVSLYSHKYLVTQFFVITELHLDAYLYLLLFNMFSLDAFLRDSLMFPM